MIEERLEWLADEFGLDIFARRSVILPFAEYFPDPYNGGNESVRTLLDRVCSYMDADPAKVELSIFDDRKRTWLVNDQGHYLPGAGALRAIG